MELTALIEAAVTLRHHLEENDIIRISKSREPFQFFCQMEQITSANALTLSRLQALH